jgi:chemotaxis protein CheD
MRHAGRGGLPLTGALVAVKAAEFHVAGEGVVLHAAGLGSCVAVMLYDAAARVTGLAHVMLPAAPTQRRCDFKPAKYADTAVPLLQTQMRHAGARGVLVAKLVGGSRMFGSLLGSGVNIGERNVEAAREALRRAGIPVLGEDVGGEYGRSVHVESAAFRVIVTSLSRGKREI